MEILKLFGIVFFFEEYIEVFFSFLSFFGLISSFRGNCRLESSSIFVGGGGWNFFFVVGVVVVLGFLLFLLEYWWFILLG